MTAQRKPDLAERLGRIFAVGALLAGIALAIVAAVAASVLVWRSALELLGGSP